MELKTSMERTLWFEETYGLSLDSVSFSDKEGATHTISFCDGKKKFSYKDLPEEEKNKNQRNALHSGQIFRQRGSLS